VGDASLEQLYLLFKEKDPRPYEAAAAGLARLSSEASANMLVRILHKDDLRARRAAAAALAMRSDEHARKALELVRQEPAPEVCVFAASQMSETERREAVAALPANGAEEIRRYRALVAGSARAAAADWLLGTLPKVDAATKVDLLGAWLTASGPTAGVAER
jgi:hypothetical protein